MSISHRQNGDWLITLLAAQRQLYSEAKRWRMVRQWSAVSVAVAGIAIGTAWPQALSVVGPIGALLAVAERVLAMMENSCVSRAANIQEQFDSDVLQIPWNRIVAGKKLEPEAVNEARSRFKGDTRILYDWYTSTGSLPRPIDVLVCQRTNLVWDSRLRKAYAGLLIAFLVALVLSVFIIGMVRGLTIWQFILMYLPSIAPVIALSDDVVKHFRQGNRQHQLKADIEEIWERGLEDPSQVSMADIRTIQDCVYRSRCESPPVPDWFYWRRRTKYESDASVGTQRLVEEFNQARQQASPPSGAP
ncbi:MAG: hypothetical protein HY680_07640 [Chloroflexi bacterium]|nr:hypothetical protein [Chloroflexota bacterium]